MMHGLDRLLISLMHNNFFDYLFVTVLFISYKIFM